tara:strand:+ start:16740 stop:17300 length:561 start_codon:yes stop_codon:yes gene_type:complete
MSLLVNQRKRIGIKNIMKKNKRLCLLVMPFLLFMTACGFHPIYGVNKYTPVGAETKFENIYIASIDDREGQFLRNELIDRFYRSGRPTDPQYTLSFSELSESIKELGITVDADATRGQLKISTHFTLTDNQTGEILLERSLRSIATYNILASEFTNRVSEESARENVLRDLGRQTEQQLALHFKRH